MLIQMCWNTWTLLQLAIMANERSEGCKQITAVSYNMRGFNQGCHTVRDLIVSSSPDVIMVQEHWLTPSNLVKFDDHFPQYMCYGSSAMSTAVETGVLRGRPFGGVMTLVSKSLANCTKVICAMDRFAIVMIGNLLMINVYMPCSGSSDRQCVYDDTLSDLFSWVDKYKGLTVIIGGDLNTDLDVANPTSSLMYQYMSDNNLYRCDNIFEGQANLPTYCNEALNYCSKIDYFLTNDKSIICLFDVLELYSNLSDHKPIMLCCSYSFNDKDCSGCSTRNHGDSFFTVPQLRWDRADLPLYYEMTGQHLAAVMEDLIYIENCETIDPRFIDDIYSRIIDILLFSSNTTVPVCKKNFFKFWWNQELDSLKEKSINSSRMWKSAGKPRSGPIFDKYRRDKSEYKRSIREHRRTETEVYTNDLHDALMSKQGAVFWQCWKSKFESNKRIVNYVDGINDVTTIAEHFASYFDKVCTNFTPSGANRLSVSYEHLRTGYRGSPTDNSYLFDAELVESVIKQMKRGKAAGLDGITVEHLYYCHALLPCILSKLFNIMMSISYLPSSLGQSYTVPILKSSSSAYSKSLTVDDFRGIAISPAISKVFEHCILARYAKYFTTTDNQYGFKKRAGCMHAIYTLRSITEHCNLAGSTVNICALDLSKAFDKMNHHGLFIKLMERGLPVKLLSLLENWFKFSSTCIKWGNILSRSFYPACGIRQGGVLSPYLFAVFIDGVVHRVKQSKLGCYVNGICIGVLLYADDILLMAPTVTSLQELLYVCEREIYSLDMSINIKKSSCMRIGPRFNVKCANITTTEGYELTWSATIRYLGVYIVSGRMFSCSFKEAKKAFYRAFNAIFGKIGRIASENVIVELLKSKCIPVLYYGLEACPVNKTLVKSLQFAINSCFSKIFLIKDSSLILECVTVFNCSVSDAIKRRQMKFCNTFCISDNELCVMFRERAHRELMSV